MNELYGTPKLSPGAILHVGGGCAQEVSAVSTPYSALSLALTVEIDRLAAHLQLIGEHLTPVLSISQPNEKRETKPPMRGSSQLAIDMQTKVERVALLADVLLELERRLEI